MQPVQCPRCSTVSFLEKIEKTAEGFCRVCDFPLFWTVETAEMGALTAAEKAPHAHRLPGTAGRKSSGGFPCHVCSQLNRVGAEVCFNCGANLLPQEEEQPVEDEAARLEPLEPLLVKSATKWLAIANALTVGGAAMLIATVILGFVQAITVTAPLFGDNAVASSASELAKNGLHHALPAWIGPLGFLGLGLVLAGAAITFWALNPHTAVETDATGEALPRLAEWKDDH